MPYNLNFPQALDFMRDSQPLMLTNYASIFTFVGQDHVNFNNGANSGKHEQLTFPLLAADPTPASMWRIYEDRKSTRLNSSHIQKSRMPSSA